MVNLNLNLILFQCSGKKKKLECKSQRPVESRIAYLFYMEAITFNYDVKPVFKAGLLISKGLAPSRGFTVWYRYF